MFHRVIPTYAELEFPRVCGILSCQVMSPNYTKLRSGCSTVAVKTQSPSPQVPLLAPVVGPGRFCHILD